MSELTTGGADARRLRRRDRGAVIPLVALILPVLIVMTAFAVDLGRQRASRRTMQARADVIALDMARLIDGRTKGQIMGDPGTEQAAVASAARNDIDRAKITYDFGDWVPTTPGEGIFQPVANDIAPTAVQVRARDEIDYFFQPGTGKADRRAVAELGEPEAGVFVGSFAARFPEGKDSVLALLGEALGFEPPYAQVLGFEGLVNSNVVLRDVLAELNITSPDQVAGAEVSLRDFALAEAEVLRRSNAQTDLANAALLEAIAPSLPSRDVAVGELVQLDPGGDDSALDTSFNAFDLFMAGAQLSNGTNAVSVENLQIGPNGTLALGGLTLTQTKAALTVVEKARPVEGPQTTSGRTDQVRAVVEGNILGGLNLGLLGTLGASIKVELGTAAGSAVIGASTRTPSRIYCDAPEAFDIEASSALLETRVTVTVQAPLAGPVPLTLVKAPTTDFDRPRFTLASPIDAVPQTFTPEVYSTDNGKLGIKGLSLGGGGVLGILLNPVLNLLTGGPNGGLLGILDGALLGPLVQDLGINVGGADFVPYKIDCDSGVRLVG